MADTTSRPRSTPWWKQRRWQIGAGAAAVVVAAVVVALVLGGGDDGDDEVAATTTSGGPTTTSESPPIAPLTGLPDPSGATLVRPALSAKIGNNPEARPQTGLEDADVVYEEEVEGGITRFLAVFHSRSPEAFGPIRSARAFDPEILWPIKGLFAYAGAASRNVPLVRAAPVQSFNETEAGDAVFLDRSFSNGQRPNILFGRPETFWAKASDRTPPRPLFRYLAEGAVFDGEAVLAVTVPVGDGGYRPTFTWDAEREVWLRSMNGQPHLARSGEQLSTDNVVIQFVPGSGSQTSLIGEGEVVALADGRLVRGRWSRPDRDSPTRWLDAAGNDLLLPPGRTWVVLPHQGGSLTVESATTTTS
jgi:hypothetical protein